MLDYSYWAEVGTGDNSEEDGIKPSWSLLDHVGAGACVWMIWMHCGDATASLEETDAGDIINMSIMCLL